MLNSNMLFLDNEYKADCEYKINYLNTNSDPHNNIDDLKSMTTSKDYINDGTVLHRVKKITETTNKIILELDNCGHKANETA